jgi:hypothetical protein
MSSDDEAHEDHDDDSQDSDDDSANNVQDPKGVSNSTGHQHLLLRSGTDPSKVDGMSNRFAYAKTIFDNVAKVSHHP